MLKFWYIYNNTQPKAIRESVEFLCRDGTDILHMKRMQWAQRCICTPLRNLTVILECFCTCIETSKLARKITSIFMEIGKTLIFPSSSSFLLSFSTRLQTNWCDYRPWFAKVLNRYFRHAWDAIMCKLYMFPDVFVTILCVWCMRRATIFSR